MSRVRTADLCNDLHELTINGERLEVRCRRAQGHRGYHSNGAFDWGKTWSEPRLQRDPPRPSETR